MHRLLRHEQQFKSQHEEGVQSESQFGEMISKAIRLARRQEDTFYKYAMLQLRQNKTDMLPLYQQQNERLFKEEQECIKQINNYRTCNFFDNKSYLYMVFTRLCQILQHSRQRIRLLQQSALDNFLCEAKSLLATAYNAQAYIHKHDVVEIFTLYNKNHRERFISLLPKKKHFSLAPIVKKDYTERVKHMQASIAKLKSTVSVELTHAKPLQELATLKVLATEKRVQERKKRKKKNIFKLYQILNIKPIVLEETLQFKKIIENDMRNRNQAINQEISKWEKRFFKRTKQ